MASYTGRVARSMVKYGNEFVTAASNVGDARYSPPLFENHRNVATDAKYKGYE